MLDLLIADALVVDGAGGPAFPGAVGVRADRIAWLGRDGAVPPPAERTIEGTGRVLAPGFVDVHNHSDLSPFVLPTMPSTLRQGVTTVVVGNCGSSPWPLSSWEEGIQLAYGDPATRPRPAWTSWADYLDAIDEAQPAVNVATLVGHGALRRDSMGLARRAPGPAELEAMRRKAAEAVEEGAFGMSSGLIYVPGMYAATDELVSVAEAVAAAGGLYASHIRGEGEHLFRALDEAIEIGRRAELPAHVSHLKCETAFVAGRAEELLSRFHADDDVTGDQYPYTAWCSSLSSLLPPWAPVGDLEAIVRDREGRERLRLAVEQGEPDFQSSIAGVGWNAIVVVGTREARWNGHDVASIAEELGFEPFAAMVALLREDPDTSCIGHAMDQADVRAILSDPEVFVASDASATAPDGPGGSLPVHPREYGTFPRALALARAEGLLPLEAMIRKMTSLPAERFGLRDRGRAVEGGFADLVLLDPATVRDAATFETPHAFPTGLDLVLVNGEVAWDGMALGERAGRALRRGST